jgi:hypothetical protein
MRWPDPHVATAACRFGGEDRLRENIAESPVAPAASVDGSVAEDADCRSHA